MHKRASVVAVLGLVGVLFGCGDEGTNGNATTPTSVAPATTSVATSATISTAQLDEMLLDVGDVGTGWRVGPEVTDADFSDSTKLPCSDNALNPTIVERLTPVTGIQFEPTDGSYKHLIEFLVTGEPQRLDSDLQIYFDAMNACAATTPTTIGGATLTVEPFTIPLLGDQRAAFVMTGVESPDATWYVRSAEVRVGSIATEVSLTEILPTPEQEPAVTDEQFVQLVETAVAKLGG